MRNLIRGYNVVSEDIRDILLRAAYDLLKKCQESAYVEPVMEQTAEWGGVIGSGLDLMEVIAEHLDTQEERYPVTVVDTKQFNISELKEVLDWAGNEVSYISGEGELRAANGHVKSGGWLVKDTRGKVYELEMYGSV